MSKTVKPFGMKDKLGYMFGDFGNDFTFILWLDRRLGKKCRSGISI